MTPAEAVALIEAEAERLGYWHPGRKKIAYDVMLVGLRSADRTVGLWNDRLGVLWYEPGGVPRLVLREGTTDPGKEGTATNDAKLHRRGVGIVAPGQHRGALALGVYKGQPALVQVGKITAFRDTVVDGKTQTSGTLTDIHGAHRHGPWRDHLGRVGYASLGCRVTRTMRDHLDIVEVCRKQIKAGLGDRFSETIFDIEMSPALAPLLWLSF